MKAGKLTAKQQRFVAEYLVDLNATQAAIRAGYKPKAAAQLAYEYLRKPQIAAAVQAGKAAQLDQAGVTAQKVLDEIARLAFGDIGALFDEGGNLKPIHLLTREQRSMIASLEVVKKNLEAGDGKTDVVHKLKVWDKPTALGILAKHFGLLKERIDVHGKIEIGWQE